MLRISIYHWLPIADNMLPEIAEALKKRGVLCKEEGDAWLYEWKPAFQTVGGEVGNELRVEGKINQRGFTQHVLVLEGVPQINLSQTLSSVVPKLREYTKELLFDIVPMAVKNKLAVLEEKIVSFASFEPTQFPQLIDEPAKRFLSQSNLVIIWVDGDYRGVLNAGFAAKSLSLDVPPPVQNNRARVIINRKGDIMLFYADTWTEVEDEALDGVIYKYGALVTYYGFIRRVIDILKETRDHIIPLRRQIAIALQRNTEEYFEQLTMMKRYLTYVNIKLPVIRKVLSHLMKAYTSSQFVAKVNTFTSEKLTTYLTIRSIKEQQLTPEWIINHIREDYERLEPLYDEDKEEAKVVSEELASVLEGSLIAEEVELSALDLDASRASLELDRGGRNRANALMFLSIVLSANLGVLIAGEITSLITNPSNLLTWIRLSIAVVFVTAAWLSLHRYITRRSQLFRVVIPINEKVLRGLIKSDHQMMTMAV